MARSPVPNQTGKETGAARVYTTLRNEILTMRLAPGTPLDEVGLAERFDMSRSPVREALVRLSGDGLVTILANRSTVVTPMDFARVPEFLDALDLLQRVTTRLAALHRTAADLAKIQEKQKAYEKAIAASIKLRDSLPMIEANYDFHMTIARAGRNLYFADLYRRLLDEGRRMLHLHFQFKALDPDISVEEMARDHTDIVDAIERGDADKAEECAHRHAEQFKGRFMQFMDRNLTAGVPLTYNRRVSREKSTTTAE
ncbi:HTH-type transcriptional regulator LutR [Pandoraea terrae]|uniref:HTH-type transcriptional regulator LutR n=1 Tax=Pandoraea terrae TaxID=1537710 RepID=A0A5E4ZG22_9BURK|nr:GntR family transcriptional regulator [Pandoraea terrae]VVE59587.1 HTH-type transcriptional regulator LutR [Pandoraea terrae]